VRRQERKRVDIVIAEMLFRLSQRQRRHSVRCHDQRNIRMLYADAAIRFAIFVEIPMPRLLRKIGHSSRPEVSS